MVYKTNSSKCHPLLLLYFTRLVLSLKLNKYIIYKVPFGEELDSFDNQLE